MAEATLLVGLDGTEKSDKVLQFAKTQAKLIGDCKILVCFVIEWSPYTFQTAEENEIRHRRRQEELDVARERIIDPAIKSAEADGIAVEGVVKHGHPAEVLHKVAHDAGANQIIVGRVTARSVSDHFFGSVSSRLAAASEVPVTIVP